MFADSRMASENSIKARSNDFSNTTALSAQGDLGRNSERKCDDMNSMKPMAFAANRTQPGLRPAKVARVLFTLLACLALAASAVAQAPQSAQAQKWNLVWSDEFNGPNGSAPDPSKWHFEKGGNGWGNHELETYTDRLKNAYIQDGSLVIQANKETYTGSDGITRHYTSARMNTDKKFTQAYGRFVARMKLPSGRGLWPAFWMLGNDCSGGAAIWPACGEIDIMENIGSQPRINTSTIWGPTTPPLPNGYSVERGVTLPPTKDLSKDYHVYALEWEPNVVRFYLDDDLYSALTPLDLAGNDMWVLNHPFFMLLNIAVGGDNPGPVGKHTVFPQRLYVDYVRVYSKNAGGSTAGDPSHGAEPAAALPSGVNRPNLVKGAGPAGATNIARSGTGYTWHSMTAQTGVNNQTASTVINDGNLTVGVNVDVAGEPSQNKYEAGGVTFASAQGGITQVDFVNGAIDTNGNGFFEANMALQTYNGTSWSNVSGWSLSPAYPYTTAAGGATYTFTGPALNGVLGVRIVGEVRVTGQDNSWSWIVNEVEVWAGQTADFTLTASPASQTVTAGNGTTYTATAAPANGFSGAVAMSVSGLPAGATGAFNPTSIAGGSGSSTLTIATTTATAAGTYTLTITGTSGSLTHSKTVTLVVNGAPVPNFTLTATPASQMVTAGNSTTYTATAAPANGFTGAVALTVSGLPTGATGAFNPTSIMGGSGSSTLSVSTSTATAAGTYTLTITGTSGSLTHSATVALVVNGAPVPNFTLTATPASQTVTAGNSTTYTAIAAPVNGFTGAVGLTVSGLPTGATGTFNPTSIAGGSGSSALTVSTSTATAAGTYPLTLTGTNGSLTHSATVTLVVSSGAGQTNIARSGTGYTWHSMTAQTGVNNQTASTPVNDGNLTVGVNVDVAGEPSQNQYEAGGVTFASAQNGITKVDFVNGAIDTNGNGFFEANMALQTYNGTSWSNVSGWSLSPAYPYTTAAGGATYTFTGPTLNGVLGVRIVGEVRVTGKDASWSWIVNEVEVWASQSVTPDFTLTASPALQTVTAGGGTTYTATAAPFNGFTGAVGLTVSGLPAGTTGSFNPASISGGSGNSALTVTTSGSTSAGSYTLTITGTNGSLTHSTTVTLVVGTGSGGDFSLATSPSQQTVVAGSGTTYTATVSPTGGFTGTVNLAVSGLPTGASGTFSPTSISGTGSSTLTITTTTSTPAGWYTLTATGTSGSLSHSTTVTLVVNPVGAVPTNWKGHSWSLTNGGMAGVAQGNPANISVDANGYLHLTIVNRSGTFTASEMFTQDNLGFGTYQWQLQGSIDNNDPSTVVGLFPYGPQAGIGVDGENELDIEFSKWGNTLCGGSCNADFTFYPATGHKATGPTEDDFLVNLNGGTLTTARLVWSSTSVVATVMSGLQPIGTTANVLHTWTFAPSDFTTRIPQQAMPVGMNLWCFQALPASNQEVVIQDFQFVHQ